MTAHTTLIARNEAHAAAYSGGRPATEPTLRTMILGCADHRADPAHVLGVAPNEAVIVRNPGGRVSPDFMRAVAVLAAVASVEGLDTGGFELVIMQHTDCGLSHLSPDAHAPLLAAFFDIELSEVPAREHADPWAAILIDVGLLAANPFMPPTLVVSGLVYDVDTGRAETVVPPTPLAELRGSRLIGARPNGRVRQSVA